MLRLVGIPAIMPLFRRRSILLLGIFRVRVFAQDLLDRRRDAIALTVFGGTVLVLPLVTTLPLLTRLPDQSPQLFLLPFSFLAPLHLPSPHPVPQKENLAR